MVTQCNTGLKSTRSSKVDQVWVHLKVNFMLFLFGVLDFHFKPLLPWVTMCYRTRYHKLIRKLRRKQRVTTRFLWFCKRIIEDFFIKSKVTCGNALFTANFSYKLMVTRWITRGNAMQHGLKMKIWHPRNKENKIYFQMYPNVIYFGWSGGF